MVDIGIEDSRMKYYAMIDGERRGPYELDRLAEAGVRPETYVYGVRVWRIGRRLRTWPTSAGCTGTESTT